MILIGRSRWVPPRRWKLWSLPTPALGYVLGVDVLAFAITATAVAATVSGGVRPTEWAAFAVLAVASILHLESARGIERRREMAANTSPYTNLKSLWVFAGLLLLPLSLVVALIAVSYVYSWIRVYGRTIAHRKLFSASTFILASAAAGRRTACWWSGLRTTCPERPVDAHSRGSRDDQLVDGELRPGGPCDPARRAGHVGSQRFG
ncbi:hypothetical protein [Kribbella qitaiheensis]|uniref:hypothetical protein n=1 Tax=Kribbella qitaiheensis TaxID=1544730 RepID=UPI001FE8B4E3|nr:hypothetical protein [Kribbella qitaiheensis]